MTKSAVRWILAFDASCGTCQEIARTVARACGDRLDVLPLTRPEVRRWREESLGARAPWQPTLLRVDGDDARAWTGRRLVLPLVRRLGLRPTVRLLRALGDLRVRQDSGTDRPGGIGRQQLLRLGAGLVVAGGLVVTGRTAAVAARTPGEAQAWVAANRDRLPQTYAEVIAHPIDFRKAIYLAHGPQVRSALWVEHLERYRAEHRDLTKAQAAIVDRAIELARDPGLFARGYVSREDAPQALIDLENAAVAGLGRDEARALLAVLGPADVGPALETCTCNVVSDYCTWPRDCIDAWCYTGHARCQCTESGCGSFYAWACNGVCSW